MRPTIQYRELSRRYQLDGPQQTVRHLSEALDKRELDADDFSIRCLAEALIPDGREWVNLLDPRRGGQMIVTEAVDTTAFANITGQLIFSEIMKSYEHESFVLSKVIPAIPTRFNGEKIPRITQIDPDDIEIVAEGMPFPNAGFGEAYLQTPDTVKRGLLVPVTKEAIFFDRTHSVMERASEVGTALGTDKERRLVRIVTGLDNNYNYSGSSFDTYQTSTPWINVASSNELIDWTDVDTAEQLLAEMIDPETGYPIVITAKHVLVPSRKKHAANRVFGAGEIRYTGSGALTETIAPNPMNAAYQVLVSQLMYQQIVASGVSAANADDWWFLGDLSEAFAYMENWPITVVQAPTNSEAEFTHDIQLRWKASERGVAISKEPRKVVKNYAS